MRQPLRRNIFWPVAAHSPQLVEGDYLFVQGVHVEAVRLREVLDQRLFGDVVHSGLDLKFPRPNAHGRLLYILQVAELEVGVAVVHYEQGNRGVLLVMKFLIVGQKKLLHLL